MIRVIFFVLCLFISTKYTWVLSGSSILFPISLFIISICYLAYEFIINSEFYFTQLYEKYIFNLIFALLIFFTSYCFSSSSPFLFIRFFEISVYPMILLIIFFSKDIDKISSRIFIVCINIFGSIPFMVFVYFSSFRLLIDNGEFGVINVFSPLIFFYFLLVFASKIPVFLSHFWLTKAHVAARSPCSMYLASLMLKVAGIGMFKFSSFFFVLQHNLSEFLSYFLFGGMFFRVLIFRFVDLKVLIACSSLSHISFIFIFFSLMDRVSCQSGFYLMVSHGICSFVLFYILSVIYESYQNRSIDFVRGIESHNSSFRLVTFLFLLINLGFPPFAGFISELLACSTLSIYRSISCLFFCLIIISLVVSFIFSLTKIVFGKKNFLRVIDFARRITLKLLVMFFSYLFLVLFI